MPSPFEINKAVEKVIEESKQPALARMIIEALNAGRFDEPQQGHAMALLQLWDIDLYDLGLAMLSEQSADEIARIADGDLAGFLKPFRDAAVERIEQIQKEDSSDDA